MSSPTPLSMRSAASCLLRWVDQQHQKHPNNPKAVRAQVEVHPGRDAPLAWLRANRHPQKLFFRSREQSFEVAALGFAHVSSGPVFTEDVQSSLVAILNPKYPEMRFYGGCRFDASPQSKRDEEWRPYEGFTFVLPAIELYRSEGGQFFLAVNYYPPAGRDVLQGILRSVGAIPLSLQTQDPSFGIPEAQVATDLTNFQSWDKAMTTILDQLSSGEYDKIVLARRKRFSSPNFPPDPVHVLMALDEQNNGPSPKPAVLPFATTNDTSQPRRSQSDESRTTYLFCLQLDHDKAFVGCTPERLFFFKDRSVWTEALAGTVRRGADGSEGEVLSELLSQKNLEEHRFVVEYIRTALSDCGIHAETNGPHIRRLPRLMHLATHIRGEFPPSEVCSRTDRSITNPPRPVETVFQILRTMHPTPAVCGMPRRRTMDELRHLEDFDRGFFAGPLGWFSSDSGEFCVAIRSGLIHGSNVTAFAGSGIVQASESKSEWDETELKMSAFTDLFSTTSATRRDSSDHRCGSKPASPQLSPKYLPQQPSTEIGQLANAILMPLNNEFGEASSGVTTSALSGISHENKASRAGSQTSSVAPSSVNSIQALESHIRPTFEDPGYFETSQIESMPNINALWGCCCIEELCRNGVNTFFVAPGSRSAPLAIGVVRSRHARLFVAHDERGAGFLAVGFARATRRAAAVITSSGTAVANLLPAVVEASVDSLPLIILTADRPPELRDVGANQAIFQADIFGNYTLWSKEVPCPSSAIPLRNLLSDIDHAVWMSGSVSWIQMPRSGMRPCGPVHLNMMFREALAPDHQSWDRSCLTGVGQRWLSTFSPLTSYGETLTNSLRQDSDTTLSSRHWNLPGTILGELLKKSSGIIVIAGGTGSAQSQDDCLAIYEIARLLVWPVIPDVCSGLRFDNTFEGVVHYADQIFTSKLACELLRPDAVLQFGERLTSKRISKLIEAASVKDEGFVHVVVSHSKKRVDPLLTVTHRVCCDIPSCLHALELAMPNGKGQSGGTNVQEVLGSNMLSVMTPVPSKISLIPEISQRVEVLFRDMLNADETEPLTEPWCARVLSESLPCPGALFIGNSMPIRDMDAFAGAVDGGLNIKAAANRGASGIDGILSSGIGFGIGLNMDVTIVLGDMSMIHDINALHLLRSGDDSIRVLVTIVVVNNGGGGIFSMLPVSKHRNVFSPVFDTPHDVEFRKGCEMFGVHYDAVRTPRELRNVLGRQHEGHRVVEALVLSDHACNAALHQRLGANVAQLVSAVLSENP